MTPWRTAIIDADETHIRVRGYDVTDLMRQAGFVDTVFLLHRGRLPTAGEKRVLDAVLVAVADHGPGAPSCAAARLAASGNRQSISAAIAAGVLAIGDEHGGAGEACMALIAASLAGDCSAADGGRIEAAAARAFAQARETRTRMPGLGHRVHTRRSARLSAVRPGRRGRRRRRGHPLRARARGGGHRGRQAAAHQHRRRARSGAARHGFPAIGGKVHLHHRTGRRTHRGSRRRARPRKGHAHPHSGGVRRRGATRRSQGQRTSWHGRTNHHGRRTTDLRRSDSARACRHGSGGGLRSGHGRSTVPRGGMGRRQRSQRHAAGGDERRRKRHGQSRAEPARQGARHSSRRAPAEEHGRDRRASRKGHRQVREARRGHRRAHSGDEPVRHADRHRHLRAQVQGRGDVCAAPREPADDQ